jgi:hypothetical protein
VQGESDGNAFERAFGGYQQQNETILLLKIAADVEFSVASIVSHLIYFAMISAYLSVALATKLGFIAVTWPRSTAIAFSVAAVLAMSLQDFGQQMAETESDSD